MRVLVLGLDNSVLDRDSALAKRTVEYGGLVEKYIVIVPAKENKVVQLSNNTWAYGIKVGNKVKGLLGIYYLAKALLKKEKYDVVSAQDQYYLGWVAMKLAKKFKMGLEIQIHGFEKYKGLRKLVAKYVLPRASSVRCVSQRLKKQLVDKFKIDEEKITVVPIFMELATHNVEREMSNNIKFVFLTIGRLVPVKNIEMQIRTMAEVVKKYPNVELWIAGEGSEKGKLELEIRNLELGENIKMLGWKKYLEEYYRRANAFLLISNSEGWGLAIIEAASYGLPIIMTDVGCAGEVIKDGESGIVIPVGDQKKLEEAMIKLIENENLREKLSKNAQEEVKKLPSKEETLNLYKKSWELAMRK